MSAGAAFEPQEDAVQPAAGAAFAPAGATRLSRVMSCATGCSFRSVTEGTASGVPVRRGDGSRGNPHVSARAAPCRGTDRASGLRQRGGGLGQGVSWIRVGPCADPSPNPLPQGEGAFIAILELLDRDAVLAQRVT